MRYLKWDDQYVSSFTLGAAQLGTEYGYENDSPNELESKKIIDFLLSKGVNCFDTAQAYGRSESILGKHLPQAAKRISKLSSKINFDDVVESSASSSYDLGTPLWCIMIHDSTWLDHLGGKLGRSLSQVRNEGLSKYIGASVYTSSEAKKALNCPLIQVVQIPYNLWDQRMLDDGIVDLAKSLNKLLFIRSVFLKGKILRGSEFGDWRDWAHSYGETPVGLLIRSALSLGFPLVLGVDSVAQAALNVSLVNKGPLPPDVIDEARRRMPPWDESIGDPRQWR